MRRKDMEIALETDVVSCSFGVVVSTSVSHTEGPRFDPWIEHVFTNSNKTIDYQGKTSFFDSSNREV